MTNLVDQAPMPPRNSTKRIKLSPQESRRRANARTYVHTYHYRGQVAKEKCFICGSTKQLEFHHGDYGAPLDVVCLCHAHHQMLTHGKLSLLPGAVKGYIDVHRTLRILNYKAEMEKIVRNALHKCGPLVP